MNIKILDSWLRDYLITKATPQDIARNMSLTSVSIERMEPYKNDFIYDIEVTTNRPDLLSATGLAREAAAVLSQAKIPASYQKIDLVKPKKPAKNLPLTITSDNKLVRRICAIVLEVVVKPSPQEITTRLETSEIRSLNNIIDITNYIMRTTGHPAHVFDYDRLPNHTIRVRESRNGEQITTLDGKNHTLPGGDIVADDGMETIVDLLGIMGLKNSVVTNDTKRIVLFIDNNDEHRMRQTSMKLGIRTDAVQINEKGVDPELSIDALLYGITLYEKYADGVVASEIIDIYPSPHKNTIVSVTEDKIQRIMGIPITLQESAEILKKLGFNTTIIKNTISAIVPSYRALDIAIPEDLVEEIARVYGYHNLPSILPVVTTTDIIPFAKNPFYWEQRAKNALKYWGYTEVYTYPMVSEDMYEGPLDQAVKLANPLGEEFVYMRKTLVPSLLKVMRENTSVDSFKIFEIANVYQIIDNDLPREIRMFAGLIKEKHGDFFVIKGLIEQLAADFGIKNISFIPVAHAVLETEVRIDKKLIGTIEILDTDLINFELNFELFLTYATLHKTYVPINKYPPIIEDLALIIDDKIPTGDIIAHIQSVDSLIVDVSLLDKYNQSRTFHIVFQHPKKNLTGEEVAEIRKKIISSLQKKFSATVK